MADSNLIPTSGAAGKPRGSNLDELFELVHETITKKEVAGYLASTVREVCDPSKPNFRPNVAHKFLKLLQDGYAAQDSHKIAADRLSITDDELYAELNRIALEQIGADSEFRRRMVLAAIEADPDLIELILDRAERVHVVDPQEDLALLV